MLSDMEQKLQNKVLILSRNKKNVEGTVYKKNDAVHQNGKLFHRNLCTTRHTKGVTI
jgi:hypothetical protein